MDNVYINAKNFKNDDFSIIFKKDLITIEELVDKIYELNEILEEKEEEIEKLQYKLSIVNNELVSCKSGFKDNMEDY